MSTHVEVNARVEELPDYWNVCPLSEVASKISGQKPDSVVDEPVDGFLPYMTAEAYNSSPSKFADPDSGKVCSTEDVLLVWDGSVGKVIRGREGVIGSTMASIQFDREQVLPEFGYYYLFHNRERIAALAEGTTILHLPTDFMDYFDIIIPPIEEQEKTANLLTSLDNALSGTEDVIRNISQIKSGTVNNFINVNEELFETDRINIGPRKFDISRSWKIKTIDKLTLSGKEGLRGGPPGGKIKSGERTSEGYRVYVQENINQNDFEMRDDYIPEEKFEEVKGAEVTPGDVLVTLRGSIGNAAVVPEGAEKGIISNSLIRLRTKKNLCRPSFLSSIINESQLVDIQIQSLSNDSGRKGLNNKIVKQIKIPLPPINRQSQLVKTISSIDCALNTELRYQDDLEVLKESLMYTLLGG